MSLYEQGLKQVEARQATQIANFALYRSEKSSLFTIRLFRNNEFYEAFGGDAIVIGTQFDTPFYSRREPIEIPQQTWFRAHKLAEVVKELETHGYRVVVVEKAMP